MRLKELHLAGFKSFAKKTTLFFDAPITAIVGPNGAGKSNVAESFRFALGEQSMKAMRGKRGDDLIWSGSRMVPKSNRASVKVVFDNASRRLGVDFDEVSLERAVFRDASHEYLVNGSKVRLKDMFELLAQAHVGSSGHHIISQGEADRALLATPRERKAMMEEALGLRIYEFRRAETARKRVETKANMQEVASLRRENAPQLSFLKKQVEKAEEARALKERLVLLYGRYFSLEHQALTDERDAAESECEALRTRIETLKAELAMLPERNREGVPKEITSQIGALGEELAAVRARKETCTRDIGRLEGMLEALTKTRHARERSSVEHRVRMVSTNELEEVLKTIDAHLDVVSGETDTTEVLRILADVRERLYALLPISRGDEGERSVAKESSEKHINDSVHDDIEKLQTELVTVQAVYKETTARETDVQRMRQALYAELGRFHEASREAERTRLALERDINDAERLLEYQGAKAEDARAALAALKQEEVQAAIAYGRNATAESDSNIEKADSSERSTRKHEIERLKIVLENMDPGAGEAVQKEYESARERDAFLARELADLAQADKSLAALIDDLEREVRVKFVEGVEAASGRFHELFALMFDGGRASLVPVRGSAAGGADAEAYDNAEAGGVELDIALPHKRVRGLHALSGGERALTSIALTFALMQVNPQPFLILDETDAALDESNSRRYGDMIERLAEESQLILITHNRETMSRAGVLYGVTMGHDGCSQLLSVKFEDAVAVAKV